MLERALREAQDGSGPGQHIALVTLDGACEYAIRLCAHHRGLALKPDTSFHAAIDALRKSVPEWTQARVRSVIELHAARNQAQHIGLLPDPELIPGWSVDASAFIHELIAAALDEQLDDVLLAQAIRDEELRGLLSEAERQLNAGDLRAAFRYSDEALRQARLRWLEQRGAARQAESDLLYGNTPVNLPPVGDPADQLEVQIFAADMSAYTQLLTTRHHLEGGGPELEETEVRSALLFVFDWILRWEVFNAGYPAERYAEYWRSIRAPQLDDDGPSRIAWHIESYLIETGPDREDEYEMLLQLANLPERQAHWGIDFPVALQTAADGLPGTRQITFTAIDPRGTLRVRVPVSADPGELLRILNRAVEIATERYERRDQDMQAWRREAGELRDSYTKVLRDAASDEMVFGDVDVTPELTGTGVRFMVSLDVPAATMSDLNLASKIFSGQGGHLAGASQQAGKIVFEAFPLTDTARESLAKAIRDSEAEILRYRDIAAKAEHKRRHFTEQIEDLLGAVPTVGTDPGPAANDETE